MTNSERISKLLFLIFALLFIGGSHAELDDVSQYVEVFAYSRFATTIITTNYDNFGSDEVTHRHTVVIPNDAFITNFTMMTSETMTVGRVEEAAEAARILKAARDRGETASTVSHSRNTNEFVVEITVRGDDYATLTLTYQQVLQRSRGFHRLYVHVPADEDIQLFDCNVQIFESNRINRLIIPEPREGLISDTVDDIVERAENDGDDLLAAKDDPARTDFGDVTVEPPPNGPPLNAQAGEPRDSRFILWNDITERDVPKDLVVLFDTDFVGNGNEMIQTVDGFFVHFLTPNEEQLTTGDKNMVFIMDKSGSMRGQKFSQVQVAMKNILQELESAQGQGRRGNDKFSIMMFSTGNEFYRDGVLQPANDPNAIQDAIRWVESRQATGYTNISGAITAGIDVLDSDRRKDVVASGLIFLTDGIPTRGILKSDKLVNTITDYNRNDHHIHTLAFGSDADYPTLQRISQNNRGVARKVFVDSDADIQLEGFYKEVAAPMLTDLTVTYSAGVIDPESLVINGQQMQSPSFDVARKKNGQPRYARFSDGTLNEGSQMIVTGQTAKILRRRRGKRAAPRRRSPARRIRYRTAKGVVRGKSVQAGKGGKVKKFKNSARCRGNCKKVEGCKVLKNPEQVKQRQGLFKPRGKDKIRLIDSAIGFGGFCPINKWSKAAQEEVQKLAIRQQAPQSDMMVMADEPASGSRERLLPANAVSGFIQRFWAFLTVRRLINERAASAKDQKSQDAKAVELSKKYNFVNELTSMVVVESDGTPLYSGFEEFSDSPLQPMDDKTKKTSQKTSRCAYPVCIAIDGDRFDVTDKYDASDAQERVNRALNGLGDDVTVCLLQYTKKEITMIQNFAGLADTQKYLTKNSTEVQASLKPMKDVKLPKNVRLAVIFTSKSKPALKTLFDSVKQLSSKRSLGLFEKSSARERTPQWTEFFRKTASATSSSQHSAITSIFDTKKC